MNSLINQTVSGRFEVRALLPWGSPFETYQVWDPLRSAHLVMRVLPPDLAGDSAFLRSFQRRMDTLADLKHVNILRFYNLDQDEEVVFLLSEYADGTSLDDKILNAGEPLTTREMLEIMEPVCAALNHAHKSGIPHCGIKPANILITNDGLVKMSDFGLNCPLAEIPASRRSGVLDPYYTAPEILSGYDPTTQSDIYSLGIVLYEMLTGGERPYNGEAAQITGSDYERLRWEQLFLESPPLKQHNPDIPPYLETAVLHCLEKLPSKRFLSVNDLYGTLSATSHSTLEPAPAMPDTSSKSPPDSFMEHPSPTAAPTYFPPDWDLMQPPPESGTTSAYPEPDTPFGRARMKYSKHPLRLLAALLAVLALVAGSLAVYSAYSGQNQANVLHTITAAGTSTPTTLRSGIATGYEYTNLENEGYVKVIENLDQINYQVGNQSPSKATSGDQIPTGDDVRLWTISGNAKLGLSDGSVFVIDRNTTIWLSSITSDTNPDVKARVTIERGNVLVLGGPVRMETKSSEFRTWSDGAVMGVRYQPAEGIFRVECFGPTGSCCVQGSSGFYELKSGQSMGFEGSSSGNTEPADYESWAGLGGPDMPQPTPTPTMTLTSTPTSTPTPTPTLLVKPDKPDKDQDEPKEKPKPEPPDPPDPP